MEVSQSSVPTIVLGSGITALGSIRVLARAGIETFAADALDPLLSSSRWFQPVPTKRVGPAEGGLAEWLEDLPFSRAVLIPCTDHWAAETAALESSMRERFRASVPAYVNLTKFTDKGRFAQLLREAKVPHPWSAAVTGEDDLKDLSDEAIEAAILKPRDSQSFVHHFGVKALWVESRHDAVAQLRRATAHGFSMILQDFIPGPPTNHYFVDGFVDRLGVVRAMLVRQRLRMYPGDFGNSTYMVSVPAERAAPAIDSLELLLATASYRGIFSAEFKLDVRDGIFKLLEVNARPWWYVDFTAQCGVDVCRMAHDDALGLPVESVSSYAVGRRLVFPYYDFHACNPIAWLQACMRSTQPVFRFDDPLPGMRATAQSLGRAVQKRARQLPPTELQPAPALRRD